MSSRLVRLSASALVVGVFGVAGVAAAFAVSGAPGDSPKPPTASPDSPCPPSNKNCSPETKPAETKPAETKPAETQPPEIQPVETKPAETKPAETKPAEIQPAETRPAESQPAETEPAETRSTSTKPATTTANTSTVESGGPAKSPPPGKVDVVPTGTVLVKLPGASEPVPVAEAVRIPNGAEVDVTKGQISLRTSDGSQGTFSGGRFVIAAGSDRTPAGLVAASRLTELRLSGGSLAKACQEASRRSAAVGKSKKPIRRLWGKAKGHFRTKGRFASATVRGTVWLTEDRCDGTLVRVRQGVVEVLDLRLKKRVLVKAGRSYLARAS